MDFDHVDDDLLDGCGFDERRFAQPTNETEIDKIETALGT